MDNNICNTKRTSLHHRPTEERTRTEGDVNDGRKFFLAFHGTSCIPRFCRNGVSHGTHKKTDYEG